MNCSASSGTGSEGVVTIDCYINQEPALILCSFDDRFLHPCMLEYLHEYYHEPVESLGMCLDIYTCFRPSA